MAAKPRVLITGGTGFAGTHLVNHLLETQDLDLHVTSFGSNQSIVAQKLGDDRVHQLDLTDEGATAALIQELRPDQLYHLAALSAVGTSFESPAKVMSVNTRLQVSLLEALRHHSPQTRTLIIGSAQEYDLIAHPPTGPISENHPLGAANPYGVSKIDQDLLALSYYYSYQLPIIRTRPFNHIGEGQTPDFAIPAFAKQIIAIKRGQQNSIKVGNLEAIRDLSDVKDIVAGYQLLMEKGELGQVYNLGSGKGYKVGQVLEQMIELSGHDITIEVDPDRLRPLDVREIIADNSKIVSLGFEPTTDISQTLLRVLQDWESKS